MTADVDFFKTLLVWHEEAQPPGRAYGIAEYPWPVCGIRTKNCLTCRMPLCGYFLLEMCRKKSVCVGECLPGSSSVSDYTSVNKHHAEVRGFEVILCHFSLRTTSFRRVPQRQLRSTPRQSSIGHSQNMRLTLAPTSLNASYSLSSRVAPRARRPPHTCPLSARDHSLRLDFEVVFHAVGWHSCVQQPRAREKPQYMLQKVSTV